MSPVVASAAFLALLLLPGLASAHDVGRVDHLKQGQEPAKTAKVPDGVDNRDMVRTQEQSQAQLGFVDEPG